jgi:hypothetical protein
MVTKKKTKVKRAVTRKPARKAPARKRPATAKRKPAARAKPATKAKHTRPTIKWEWKPTWKYVRERIVEPTACEKGQYRTKRFSPVEKKDVYGVLCCPKGTKLKPNNQGCFRGRTRVGSMMLQSMRHDITKFKKNHPDIWRKLMMKKPDSSGIRTVKGRKG